MLGVSDRNVIKECDKVQIVLSTIIKRNYIVVFYLERLKLNKNDEICPLEAVTFAQAATNLIPLW